MTMCETADTHTQYAENTDVDLSSRASRGQRVETLRKMTRLSRQEFARVHGLPYGSLQNWEDPKYGGLTKTGAPRVIAAFLKEGIVCNESWLLDGEGPTPYVSASVLLDRMQLKSAGFVRPGSVHNKESLNMEDEVSLFQHHYKDTLNMVVFDEGLLPTFSVGDHVAGLRFEGEAIAQFVGMTCIVQQQGSDECLLRQLERSTSERPGTYNLVCTYEKAMVDQKVIEDAELASVAPVAWVRKRIDY